jgi:hypothetical protein
MTAVVRPRALAAAIVADVLKLWLRDDDLTADLASHVTAALRAGFGIYPITIVGATNTG